MPFNLSKAKEVSAREERGTVVHLKDETGAKLYTDDNAPVTMTVVGSYSATYRRASDAARDAALQSRRNMMEGDKLDSRALGIQAACVKAWEGIESDGVPVPLTLENVTAVLEQAPWIRDQVDAAITDHASFSKPA